MAEQNNKWLDDLMGQIDQMFSDSKSVKFNTHKNRKLFFGKVKTLIADAVKTNTTPLPVVDNIRVNRNSITHPNPNPSKGFSIMTEGLSQKGDDVKPIGNPSLKSGMRSW